jgi:cell wall-associated NlpC family hydrolase
VKLEAGDVFLVAGTNTFAKLVRFFTRSKGEAPTQATHVGMVIQAGSELTAIVMEAQPRGVVRRQMYPVHAVYRSSWTATQIQEVIARALEDEGKPYGWGKIAASALDWCLGGLYLFRRLTDTAKAPDCSFAVWDWSQGAEVKPFGCNRNCAPDDIADYVEQHWQKVA